jgi:1-acyl-sn-glycerol-3-phosphate acyltransferase
MSGIAGSFLTFSVRLLCGASARWVGSRPDLRQRIYCANHTSHLDSLVIWAALPDTLRERTRPVAAADYWQSGLRRLIAQKVFRAILIERGGKANDAERQERARAAVERTAAEMGDQDSVILFPEGTRGPGEELLPFKSGIYYLCLAKPGIELVPVYLHNLSRVMPKGEFAPVPLLASVTFGPPTRLGSDENKDDFLARLRQAIWELRKI